MWNKPVPIMLTTTSDAPFKVKRPLILSAAEDAVTLSKIKYPPESTVKVPSTNALVCGSRMAGD